jgi:uncharacterized protein (TIGR02597 family)
MKKLPLSILSALALASATQAQTTVNSDPVGFVSKTVPANSDATLSASVSRPAAYTGAIASLPDASTIQVSGTPGWTVNNFVTSGSHYCLIASGARAGMFATITANSSNTVTLAFVNQDLGSTTGDKVLPGDTIKIIPYWTLSTLLPDATKPGGFVPNQSTVLLFSRDQAGSNQSASHVYTLYSTFGWYDGGTLSDNQIVYPDESFIVRSPSGAAVPIVQTGVVPMSPFRTVLNNETPNVDQDTRITTGVPVPVALKTFMDVGALGDQDKVLIFDDAAVGKNKSATSVFTYYAGFGWYDGGTNVDNYQIQPSQGIIYRKLGSNTNPLLVTYKPSYQP